MAHRVGVNMIMQCNPYLTNRFSHHYQLDESTFVFRGVRCDFICLSHISMTFLCANRIPPDGTPRSAASHLGLFCLPMSQKRTPGLNELSHIMRKSVLVYIQNKH